MFSHLRTCVSFYEETGCWLKLTVEPRSLGSSASVALAVAWRLIPAPLQGCREDERSLSWRVPGVCARSVSGSFGIASKDVRFQVRTVCTHARVAPFPVLGDTSHPPAGIRGGRGQCCRSSLLRVPSSVSVPVAPRLMDRQLCSGT